MMLIGKTNDAQPASLRALGQTRPVNVRGHIGMTDFFKGGGKMSMLRSNLQRAGSAMLRDEFFAKHRTAGTLQIRTQHRHLASTFEEIGHADMTAHVDWTSLAERAQRCGLSIIGFTDQHHFITGIISEFGRGGSPEPPANASPARTDWGQSPLPFDSKRKRELPT